MLVEDKQFLKIASTSATLKDGHYHLKLPFARKKLACLKIARWRSSEQLTSWESSGRMTHSLKNLKTSFWKDILKWDPTTSWSATKESSGIYHIMVFITPERELFVFCLTALQPLVVHLWTRSFFKGQTWPTHCLRFFYAFARVPYSRNVSPGESTKRGCWFSTLPLVAQQWPQSISSLNITWLFISLGLCPHQVVPHSPCLEQQMTIRMTTPLKWLTQSEAISMRMIVSRLWRQRSKPCLYTQALQSMHQRWIQANQV